MQTRSQFVESSGWQVISQWLSEQREIAREAVMSSADFATVRYFVGLADAIEYMLTAPDSLLVENELTDGKKPDNLIDLVRNRRRVIASAY